MTPKKAEAASPHRAPVVPALLSAARLAEIEDRVTNASAPPAGGGFVERELLGHIIALSERERAPYPDFLAMPPLTGFQEQARQAQIRRRDSLLACDGR